MQLQTKISAPWYTPGLISTSLSGLGPIASTSPRLAEWTGALLLLTWLSEVLLSNNLRFLVVVSARD
eukprot:1152969-Pelagomonas_calceolata.AAC.2